MTTELGYEGGFADDPRDPGGATMLGITQGTLSHWLGRQASVDEVRALAPATVAPIYRALYWNTVQGDALPGGVDLLVFDESINSGPSRAARTLQEAVGAVADGMIGPATLAAVAAADPLDVIDMFTQLHEAFYRSLSAFKAFGHGWLSRLHSVAQKATALASQGTQV